MSEGKKRNQTFKPAEINKPIEDKSQPKHQERQQHENIDKKTLSSIKETDNSSDVCEIKLDCKKKFLNYIDQIRLLSHEGISEEQLCGYYKRIDQSIEQIKHTIKPNTVLQLRKELSAKLGKYAPSKSQSPENHFIKFFKEAYPKNKRYKDFTWVLMDIDKISDEQILHTLKYINSWCFKNKLSSSQKKDIREIVKKIAARGNIKYINQVKSMEGLNKGLNIKIISVNNQFDIISLKK